MKRQIFKEQKNSGDLRIKRQNCLSKDTMAGLENLVRKVFDSNINFRHQKVRNSKQK
jgi:hypothetical protein